VGGGVGRTDVERRGGIGWGRVKQKIC